MSILQSINLLITFAVAALVVAAILLIILRVIFNYADVNPFTWHARNVRRATDPVLAPARAILMGMRLDPNVAPFIVVIFVLVAGYVVVQVAGTLLNTIAGIVFAVSSHSPDMAVAIIVRIIFVWIGMSYANAWNRLLIKITEPLLAPLRRVVPMVGMFDISPI